MKRRKMKVKARLQEDPKTVPFVIALANKMLSVIGFVDFINRNVDWDPKQWSVSPGNLTKAVVLSTFFDMRVPLSNIEKRFGGMDTELLFVQA